MHATQTMTSTRVRNSITGLAGPLLVYLLAAQLEARAAPTGQQVAGTDSFWSSSASGLVPTFTSTNLLGELQTSNRLRRETAAGSAADGPANRKKNKKKKKPKKKGGKSKKRIMAECLAAHNKLRRLHGVPDLEWDEKLTKFAQKRSNHIAASDGAEFGHPPDLEFGENLFWHSSLEKGCEFMVRGWYDEIELYDFKAPTFAPATGHFTQLIWRGTTRVGCAFAQSSGPRGGLYLTCNYDPPGNFVGEFEENVPRPQAVGQQAPRQLTAAPATTTSTTTTTTTTTARPTTSLDPTSSRPAEEETRNSSTAKPKKNKKKKKKSNKKKDKKKETDKEKEKEKNKKKKNKNKKKASTSTTTTAAPERA